MNIAVPPDLQQGGDENSTMLRSAQDLASSHDLPNSISDVLFFSATCANRGCLRLTGCRNDGELLNILNDLRSRTRYPPASSLEADGTDERGRFRLKGSIEAESTIRHQSYNFSKS